MTYRPYSQIKTSAIQLNYENNSGIVILKGTPVCQKGTGVIDFINVSSESDVFGFIGVTSFNIPNATSGPVVTSGRIENVSIFGNFGDPVYVSKTGGLTITKPEVGAGGFLVLDFVLRVGIITKNESNPLLKDIVLDVQLVGQL